MKPETEAARLVLAEGSARMPLPPGDSFVPVDEIDSLVPVDYPILGARIGVRDETARSIGRYVANLIEDGSTIQMGIGTISDPVLQFLREQENLAVHTEMISDGMMHRAYGAWSGPSRSPRPRTQGDRLHRKLLRAPGDEHRRGFLPRA